MKKSTLATLFGAVFLATLLVLQACAPLEKDSDSSRERDEDAAEMEYRIYPTVIDAELFE